MKEIKGDKYAFMGLFCAVLVFVYIYNTKYTVLILVQPGSYQRSQNRTTPNARETRFTLSRRREYDPQERISDEWCRIQEAQFNWRRKLATCEGATSWVRKRILDSLAPEHQTAPNLSYVHYYDIKSVLQVSKLIIQSVSVRGKWKQIGGDYWRVRFKGPSSVSATILDHQNGTYEILFSPSEAGLYEVYIFLDYTLCNGMLDPPSHWFIKGNSQGKYQSLDIIGKTEDFLGQPLGNGQPFRANIADTLISADHIKAPTTAVDSSLQNCANGCPFLWSSYGSWKNHHWIPYQDDSYLQGSVKDHVTPSGHLLIYGDSVSAFFYDSIKWRSLLCKSIFLSCEKVYGWIYRVQNINEAKMKTDSLDFNVTRVISELEATLSNGKYQSEQSAVLLNFGLHFVESTNFSNYRVLIDEVVNLLTRRAADGSPFFKSKVIWKTTTAINKEKAGNPQLHYKRFLTAQRVQLYNAYSNAAMCRANIPIVDVYGVSDAYSFGTGTHAGKEVKNDIVHYHNEVFYPLEDFLVKYFTRLKNDLQDDSNYH